MLRLPCLLLPVAAVKFGFDRLPHKFKGVVDAFLKLVKTDIENTENFFQRLAELSEKHNVKFVLSVNVDDAVAPEFIKKYFI